MNALARSALWIALKTLLNLALPLFLGEWAGAFLHWNTAQVLTLVLSLVVAAHWVFSALNWPTFDLLNLPFFGLALLVCIAALWRYSFFSSGAVLAGGDAGRDFAIRRFGNVRSLSAGIAVLPALPYALKTILHLILGRD